MKIDDPDWWNDVDEMLTHDEFFEVYNSILEHTRTAEQLTDALILAIDDGKVTLAETKSMTERLLQAYGLFDRIKTILSDRGFTDGTA
ncbi:MAG: hypothetical protein LBB61_05055 [Treponema sp.]|jgi:hypothetical protein|nr:hypothetical protein [Treponema sp.]